MCLAASGEVAAQQSRESIGLEIAVPHHLADGEEFMLPLRDLLGYGERLFSAVWTSQEGGGRPLTKGTGAAVSDVANPLTFPRNFNRISGPDANACAGCHNRPYGIYGEPNPFNPVGNLRTGDAPSLDVDLSRRDLPLPRLAPVNGVVRVPAYSDFKLHDITTGASDPNCEPLDMLAVPGTSAFTAGNARFLTRRLWGVGNEPPYCHHGLFTTMREAILAHAGEAIAERTAFASLPPDDQNAVIEFLKTLQVLPPGTQWLIVNEKGQPKPWPPHRRTAS